MLAAVCLGTVFLFGIVPALYASRANVNDVLKDHGRGTRGVAARRWTTAFLAVELALTFTLLTRLVDGVRSFFETEERAVAIETSNLLTTWVTLPAEKYGTADRRDRLYARLRQEAGGIGEVSSAALASALPFGRAAQRGLAVAGREADPGQGAPTVWAIAIGPGYFNTVGVRVEQGRDFTDDDGAPGRETAIVNRRLAELHFPAGSAIGQRVRLLPPGAAGQPSAWLTIVGVAPNLPQRAPDEPAPLVYQPLRGTSPATAALLLRGRTGVAGIASALRERVRAIDPDLPLYRTMTMEQAMAESRWNPRVASAIITTISGIALLLALVGLYAVAAHGVASRVREIGIRVALGARPPQIAGLVLRRTLFQLGVGLAAGVGASLAWDRLLTDATSPAALPDFMVLGSVGAAITAVGLAACLGPARRASRLDPVTALRHE
jgi:predicted permease